MKRHSQLAQVKVSSLSQSQKEGLLTFLATSHEVRMDAAQFGYGGTITMELALPASSVSQWISLQPNDWPARESWYSPERKKMATPQTGQPAPATEEPIEPPRRSCQWVHKLMEDVLAFRARQFQFEVQAILTPLNSSVGGTVREQQALVLKHMSARTTPSTDDLSVAIFKFLTKKFGVMSMVKSASSDLLHAIRFYRAFDLDVQLFGVLLSSSAYDTLDLLKYIKWRNTLYPYLIYQQEPTLELPTAVTRSFVKVCDIPALVRKCLIDRSENSEHDIAEQEPLWLRVRSAFETWCDPLGRFPGIVADPNFYCPPFRTTNPYVGRPFVGETEAAVRHRLLAQEGRFAKFDPRCVVHAAQLLTLLVLCWKEERLFPHNWISTAGHTTTVASRVASPSSAVRARTPPPSRASAAVSPAVSTRPQSPVSTHRSASPDHLASTKSSRPRASSRPATPSPGSRRGVPLNISAIRGTSVNDSVLSTGAVPGDVTVVNSSDAHHSIATSPGGASPTLRQEEEQFLRDMRSLESRLLKAVTTRRV